MSRGFAPFGQWVRRWLKLALLLRAVAVIVGLQIAALAPAVASVVAALNAGDTVEHCACCKGRSAPPASKSVGAAVSADDADCGSCPAGQPCTDCPAGCASCHSASSARLLLPSTFSIVALLAKSFDGGVIAEQQSARGPFLSSLDRPPKLALAV